MKRFISLAALILSTFATAFAATVTEDATIEGHFMTVVITPDYGCTVEDFIFSATGDNFASGNGMLEEGFGVGNYYVPNRRLNEQLSFLDGIDRPVLRLSYDCDGPNIAGIHAIRTMEPLPNEAGMRVTWKLEHRGDDTQWVAPWVRLDWLPGGAVDGGDRIDTPTMQGIIDPIAPGYYRAARNWVAATDPAAKSTVYAVFNANDTFAFLVDRSDEGDGLAAVQTQFVPWAFEPGKAWETTYRINVVRGLEHVNFATDEMAAQIDYESGQLVVRLATPRMLPPMEIAATVVGPDGTATTLEPKRFQLDPNRVIRCTYDWTAPGPGSYEFLAQVMSSGKPYTLGKETASPHGGIDAQFVVGEPAEVVYEGWTDGPYRLERSGRKLSRALAADGEAQIWVDSPLEKIFPSDGAAPSGGGRAHVSLALAQNESESFQLAIRPINPLGPVTVQVSELRSPDGGVIGSDQIRVYTVDTVTVDVPSYFEGPTGQYPDGLRPYAPFSVPGGKTSAVWVTVHAPAGTPAGQYSGLVELGGVGVDPVEILVSAEVFDFALPDVPTLKTDFGLDLDSAADQLAAAGFRGSSDAVWANAVELSAASRVTFRDVASLPAESADYGRSLAAFETRLKLLQAEGASEFYVPVSLLDAPEQLEMANAFVKKHDLRAYTQIAAMPPPTAWQAVYEACDAWKQHAPDIPAMMTNYGLQPFLSDAAPIWAVHSPMLDTTNNKAILEYPGSGGEVWWFVNHAPPRPYANFFIDFAAIEHRIFFWQTWALGFKGVHYWSANFVEEDQDPWETQLDVTPVNGDGFLVYPTAQGLMPSLRLEVIRDGIEDYEYLALLSAGIDALKKKGGNAAVLQKAEAARNLQDMLPNLVSFTRDTEVLATKRREIAEAIVAVQRAL